MASIAAAETMTHMAAVSPVPAAQLQMSQSGNSLAYCRRLYATTVAAPVSAAAYCGAKFAIERLFPCLPPSISATIVPIASFAIMTVFILAKS